MSSSKSEADLRVKALNVLKQFKKPFDAKAFKKAYKKQYEEKFSSGELPTRDYLMSFREISYNEEDDNFLFSSKEVKVEEESSSSDDEDCEDAAEVREEINEWDRVDEECWYDKEEFQQLLKAVKKELKTHPDPSVSVEDTTHFLKLHLLRRRAFNVASKVLSSDDKGCSSFYISDFFPEWRSQNGCDLVPLEQFGYKSLVFFLASFPEFRPICRKKYAFVNNDDVNWTPRRIIEEWKKESQKKARAVNAEISKRREINIFRQKVLAVAKKISRNDSVDGLHFCVSDFCLQWQVDHGEKLDPQAPIDMHNNIYHCFSYITSLRRLTKDKYAIESSSQPELDSNLNHKRPVAAKAATKKVLNERKKINSGNMVETAALEDKAKVQWYGEEEYQRSLRLYKEFLRTKKPDAKYDNDAIQKFVKLDLLKKKVLKTVRTVVQPSSDGPLFVFGKFIREWRRLYGNRPFPCAEFGHRSPHGFLESFSEFRRKNRVTYFFMDPLTTSGEKKADSDEFSSNAEDLCRKKMEIGNVSAKRVAATAKKPPKESSDEESLTDDDSDDEKKQQEEAIKSKKKAQVGKKFTLKQVPSDKKKVPEQKRQMVTAARKKAPAVFSSSIDGDTDSESDEETVEKVVKKKKMQPKMTPRETVVEPKTGIKEKKKSMEMEKHGRKRTIEDEPRKKALKRSHSPDVIVLDDDEPSLKVPKQEIQDAKETRLVGEEDLAKMAMPACERTSSRGQRARMSGDGAMAMGSEGKVLPPLNMMDPSSSFMPPAPGFPMPGVPPLFCPTTQQQLNLSNGGVAALFMAQLLDNAEKKGMDVDAIALEAIQLIKKKMNSEK